MVLTQCRPFCCQGAYSGRCLKNMNCDRCHPKKETPDVQPTA